MYIYILTVFIIAESPRGGIWTDTHTHTHTHTQTQSLFQDRKVRGKKLREEDENELSFGSL